MKINPNRCPKCGRDPAEVATTTISSPRKSTVYKILCLNCFTTSGTWKTRRKAIEKWNEITKGENK